MAPKNSASTRNHWAATADTKTDSPLLANGIDDEFEIWNGTALTKAVWFFQHLRLLPERRKAFVQLCRTGTAYTVKGSKIAVYHPEHAREYLNDELSVGSLEEPFAGFRGSWGAIAATPEAPAAAPYSPLPPEAAPSAADAEASESAAAGSGAPPTPGLSVALLTIAERLAEHPAVSGSSSAPKNALTRTLGVDYASNFIVAPHVIDDVDLEFLNYWLERIEDLEIRISYREKCDGSGRKFVRIFAAELAKAAVGQTTGTAITKHISNVLKAGIAPRVRDFNRVTQICNAWNRALPVGKRKDEALMVEQFKELVIALGDQPHTALTVKFQELRTNALFEHHDPAAIQAMLPQLWMTACRAVLEEIHDRELLAELEQGRALLGRDPKRTEAEPKFKPKGPWTEGVNRPCGTCKDLGLKGDHWDKDCPNKEKKKKKERKESKPGTEGGEAGKAALSRASEQFFAGGASNELDLAMLQDPEQALATLASGSSARALVARGQSASEASQESPQSGESSDGPRQRQVGRQV
jgi:hypothetical protein